MWAAILLVLSTLAPWHGDRESADDRLARLTVYALAIDIATSRAVCEDEPEDCRPIWHGPKHELAATLAMLAWWESRLARHVHAGQCGPLECDAYRYHGRTVHRATSGWQIQASSIVPLSEWRTLAGLELEATTRAAWAAARVLSRARATCGSLEGAIAGYAGARCSWSRAGPRARHARAIARQLRDGER